MIVIATITKNPNGVVIIHEDPASRIREAKARVKRTPTLDGKAAINHQGFSESDRTFTIRAKAVSEQEAGDLWALFKAEKTLRIANEEAVFTGSMESLRVDSGDVRFRFLVKEAE